MSEAMEAKQLTVGALLLTVTACSFDGHTPPNLAVTETQKQSSSGVIDCRWGSSSSLCIAVIGECGTDNPVYELRNRCNTGPNVVVGEVLDFNEVTGSNTYTAFAIPHRESTKLGCTKDQHGSSHRFSVQWAGPDSQWSPADKSSPSDYLQVISTEQHKFYINSHGHFELKVDFQYYNQPDQRTIGPGNNFTFGVNEPITIRNVSFGKRKIWKC